MINEDTDTVLSAEEFSALPKDRQVKIVGELLERGDFEAIQALGVKIMTADEWVKEKEGQPPDVIEIKNLN